MNEIDERESLQTPDAADEQDSAQALDDEDLGPQNDVDVDMIAEVEAPPTPRRRIRKKLRRYLKRFRSKAKNGIIWTTEAVISPFCMLLGKLTKKDPKTVLFMGRFHSGFLDNVKYLYLYLYEHGYQEKYDIYFIGHKDAAIAKLKAKGFNAVKFPSFKAYRLILHAGLIITDNAHWTTHNRYNMSLSVPKVQMWHGIGFKRIRLSDDDFVQKSKGLDGFLKYRVPGQLAVYDLFISTSKFFTDEVFRPSFQPKEIVEIGYPRNDVLFDDTPFLPEHLNINADKAVLEKLKKLKALGKKIVLYAPTFRKARHFAFDTKVFNFSKLDDFAAQNDFYIVFKLHPLPNYKINFSSFTNIIEYNNACDGYPMFRYIDLMITDYSSIYMDYLLLDRPILFFLYDLEYYRTVCRDIRPDFMELSPGEKCMTQAELHSALYAALVENRDEWAGERKRIRDMSWDYQDGNTCKRVWECLEQKYLQSGVATK